MNKNITATILIVLAIGIYFTVTDNILADAKTVQVVNAEYRSAIDSAKKLIAVRDKVIADYNNVSESDRERIAKMIPGSVDNIRLIIDLNNVGLRHGFSLQGIKAVATPNSNNNSADMGNMNSMASIATPVLDTVKVSFSVTAPYLQFISFLQDLESNLRIMDLTNLSMVASDSGTYNFKVELKTYWLRQQ